jgi:predicted pyridoxine 5'-phosphate oxidase superfamily flavin-nucleotide-binding protein
VIPESLRKFVSERFDREYNGVVGVLASRRSDGSPNASPKHFRIRDDTHLEFTDVFSQTLGDVLKKTPEVTVVFFDPQAVTGFKLRGKASLETFGPLFHHAASQLENMGFKPKALVSIEINEIQSLSFGPNTGKIIG